MQLVVSNSGDLNVFLVTQATLGGLLVTGKFACGVSHSQASRCGCGRRGLLCVCADAAMFRCYKRLLKLVFGDSAQTSNNIGFHISHDNMIPKLNVFLEFQGFVFKES